MVKDGPLIDYYKGIYFEQNINDECDMFLLKGYNGIIVTEKSKLILSSKENIICTRVEDIEIPVFAISGNV